ncbi:MAG: RNA polymerase sigma-70 factor [Bacteroidetes bacterium]|nr:RNA polymerase sigma-70 factor [Bacteroidota bacterium]
MPREAAGYKGRNLHIGEEKSFDYFFRQYYAALVFFANSIIHNHEESKDIVQDCFIKLWDSESINERFETVKSFLYTSVRNACIDFIRKKQVREKARLQLIKNNIEEDFEYFDEVAFAEMMRQVFEHIEELPKTMQRVLRMHYLQGKKYKEIADGLETSPDAIRKQKERAIKIIRQKLLLLFNIFLLF